MSTLRRRFKAPRASQTWSNRSIHFLQSQPIAQMKLPTFFKMSSTFFWITAAISLCSWTACLCFVFYESSLSLWVFVKLLCLCQIALSLSNCSVFATNDVLGGASNTKNAQATMSGANNFLEPKTELNMFYKSTTVKTYHSKHCSQSFHKVKQFNQ